MKESPTNPKSQDDYPEKEIPWYIDIANPFDLSIILIIVLTILFFVVKGIRYLL